MFSMANQGLEFKRDLNFDQVRSAIGTAAIIVLEEDFRDTFGYQPDVIAAAAERGLLIDAGHLPDKAIREIGQRGADFALRRAFDHPFGSRPWLLTHTWESDERTEFDESWISDADDRSTVQRLRAERQQQVPVTTHLYLIEPASTEEHFGAVVTEYGFMRMRDRPAEARKIKFFLVPFARVAVLHTDQKRFRTVIEGPKFTHNAGTAGSAVNPMMTALMLLNTRGIATETFAAPTLANEARKRKGKSLIPGYTRIASRDYMTAVLAGPRRRSERQSAEGEKRRSPIPHLRRGHIRTYTRSGEAIWIRDAMIGVKHEGELAWAERHRAGYRLKTEPSP